MRWLNTAVIVVLVAGILIFAFQNLQSVTVSFLGIRFSAPMAVHALIIYVVGMVTGGSAWGVMRWALRGQKAP